MTREEMADKLHRLVWEIRKGGQIAFRGEQIYRFAMTNAHAQALIETLIREVHVGQAAEIAQLKLDIRREVEVRNQLLGLRGTSQAGEKK